MTIRNVKYLDATYPSLESACAASIDGDEASIEGTWSADDTTACTIDASIDIYTDSSSKHTGYAHSGTGTWYRHRVSSGHAITITTTDTINITGLDIQNKSTGTSDEVFRINSSADPTLNVYKSVLGFDSRNDQQDLIYADSGEAPIVTLENCIVYNVYRGVVDYFQTDDGAEFHLNTCTLYNIGYASNSRSGVFGRFHTGTNYATCNIYNSYIHLNAGFVVYVSTTGDTIGMDRSKFSPSIWNSGTIDTDTNNTGSVPAVDSSPSTGDAYFEDVTTSPYDLRLVDDGDNGLQDVHTDGSGLGLTMPSDDILDTSRPQNTDYDVGAYEVESASSGAISGSVGIDLALSGVLEGNGTLSGSAGVDLDCSGNITGYAPVSGSSDIIIDLTGSLSGLSSAVGSAGIDIILSGGLLGPAYMSGSSSIDVGLSGSLLGLSGLSGSTSVDLILSGVLQNVPTGQISGSASIDWDLSGILYGLTSLSGTLGLDLILSGVLSGTQNVDTYITYVSSKRSLDFYVDGVLAHSQKYTGEGFFPVSLEVQSRDVLRYARLQG